MKIKRNGLNKRVASNKKQTRKPATPPVPRAPSSKPIESAALARIARQVCGITDPFCNAAAGAKYPDDSSLRTLSWSYHNRATIASNASGFGGCLLLPSLAYVPLVNSTAVAGNGDITLDVGSALPGLLSDINVFRIVSCGYKIRAVIAPLYQSGMVHIRALSQESTTGIGVVNGYSYAASQALDVRLQDCKEVTIFNPHTSAPPTNFYSSGGVTPSNVITTWSPSGFSPISVLITGAPASQVVLEVEYFVHYELMFNDVSQMTLLATPPPPANALVTSAANHITSRLTAIMATGAAAAGKEIERAAIKFIAARLGPLGPAVLALSD
jgi:hypothetical protein